MKTQHIDIGNEFSSALGPRLRSAGQFSGEEFRDSVLEPAVLNSDIVVIHLDSIKTISISFFEEAFGGLVRKLGGAAVLPKIRFDADARAYLVPRIEALMQEAEQERSATATAAAKRGARPA